MHIQNLNKKHIVDYLTKGLATINKSVDDRQGDCAVNLSTLNPTSLCILIGHLEGQYNFKFPCVVETEGIVETEGYSFLKCLKSIKTKTLDFLIEDGFIKLVDSNKLTKTIKLKDFRFYPFESKNKEALSPRSENVKLSLPCLKKSDLQKVLIAAPKKDLRYYLNSVAISLNKDKEIELVATDAHRLSVLRQPCITLYKKEEGRMILLMQK